MEKSSHYEIIDTRTGQKVGQAKTRASASRSCDRRDNAYGAVRYIAKAIWVTSLPVDVGTITEYGLTQKLSTPIRCF